MYSKQCINIKWNECYSKTFRASNGVRQGGIISPVLFNLYMDKLITQLKREDIGCHIGNKFIGCLCYADDLTLLSPSIKMLQRMIQICESFGIEYGVSYNSSKTMCIAFSKQEQEPKINLYLNKTNFNASIK